MYGLTTPWSKRIRSEVFQVKRNDEIGLGMDRGRENVPVLFVVGAEGQIILVAKDRGFWKCAICRTSPRIHDGARPAYSSQCSVGLLPDRVAPNWCDERGRFGEA